MTLDFDLLGATVRSFLRALSRWAGLVLCALLLGGCVDGGNAPELVMPAASSGGADLSRIHRLGVGDKMKITVFGEPDLSGSYELNATGNVAMPLIGEVVARGRPVEEFRLAVTRRLSEGYLKSPKVTVEILNYRPIYVHGEVKQAGEHPYRSGLKLRDAIAMAGGFTYRANQSFVLMTREGQLDEAKVRLPNDLDVLPGDNIRIPERLF